VAIEVEHVQYAVQYGCKHHTHYGHVHHADVAAVDRQEDLAFHCLGKHDGPDATGNHRHVQRDVVPVRAAFDPEVACDTHQERERHEGHGHQQVDQHSQCKPFP